MNQGQTKTLIENWQQGGYSLEESKDTIEWLISNGYSFKYILGLTKED